MSRDHDDVARILRALAHPNRLAIFQRLSESGLCCESDARGNTVCAIAQDFQLALSTVSHHLKELREAGLVTCERHGQHVFCSINRAALDRVLALLRPRPGGRGARPAKVSVRRPRRRPRETA